MRPDAPMVPPEAVTFDFWNTLVQEDLGARGRRLAGWLGVLEGEGFSVDPDALREAFAVDWDAYQQDWKANIQAGAGHSVVRVLDLLGLDPPPDVRDALTAVITDPAPGHEPPPTLHIGACLDALRSAGVRIGIICDVGLTPSRTLRRYLETHGLLGSFDHWSFSDEVGVFKPDPVIFHHAMAGLGVEEPSRMAHVGDLRRTDVAGANALGILSIRYTGVFDDPGRPDDGPERTAVHDLADHADLPAVLGFT